MTNLNSVLKSKDITLPTEVHIVKPMVFPVDMYGYESWIIKNADNESEQTPGGSEGQGSLACLFSPFHLKELDTT